MLASISSLSSARTAGAVDSDGRGWAWMRSRNGSELRLVARFRNLTGPLAAAHLHLGQAGTNGPVIVDLEDGVENNRIRFTVRADDLTGPLAGQDFSVFLGELAAGNVYVNLHTAAFPAGEIRGQVQLRD